MIDFARIEQKLDDLFAAKDLAGAERLLDYWLEETISSGDQRGEIQIRNEQLGLFRRTNNRDRAFATADALLPLLGDAAWEGTILLNIATDYCHFGCPERAQPLYGRVETAYRDLPETDIRHAWYHNNKAASMVATHRWQDAVASYSRAIEILLLQERPPVELGLTYVNLAMSRYMISPLDPMVEQEMQTGFAALTQTGYPMDGYYAFTLEKVLPAFRHLGYAAESAEIEKRIRACQDKL